MKAYKKPCSINYFGTHGIIPLAAIGAAVAAAAPGVAAGLGAATGVAVNAAAVGAGAAVGASLAHKMTSDDIISYRRIPALAPIC